MSTRTIFVIVVLIVSFWVLASASNAGETNWSDNLSISGDFRLRHERVDDQERDRQRLRGRILFKAKIDEDIDVGLRIATGSSSGGTSTNQTLDGDFGKKSLWLDLAYLAYHPGGYTVTAGKIKQPFYKAGKHQLIWDSDINPEGAAYSQAIKLSDADTLTITGGGFWINERKSATDARLLGAQAYLKHILDNGHAIVGISNYAYDNLDGTDLDTTEVFGEYVRGPVTLYAAHAQSQADVSSYLVGVKAKHGKWSVGYDYREVVAGAVHGGFDESDFSGKRGHKGSVGYSLTKNVKLGATGYQTDASRILQLDIKVKF
jgi:hypothetical protein